MTFVKSTGDYSLPDSEENLDPVNQGSTSVVFLSESDTDKHLFFSEGMNPCICIILYGEIEIKSAEKKTSPTIVKFALLNHNEGVNEQEKFIKGSKNQKEKQDAITLFCQDEIIRMISETQENSEMEIDKIRLIKSFLLRCIPLDKNNIQHQVAATFKKLLGLSNLLEYTVSGEELPPLIFKDNYSLECFEEPEILKHGESSSLDCFVKTTHDGQLQIICQHNPPLILKSKMPETTSGIESQDFNKKQKTNDEAENFSSLDVAEEVKKFRRQK